MVKWVKSWVLELGIVFHLNLFFGNEKHAKMDARSYFPHTNEMCSHTQTSLSLSKGKNGANEAQRVEILGLYTCR